MIKFTRTKQKTGSYCGPAVFEMLVSALGLNLSQEAIVDASGARETVMKVGTSVEDLAKGLKKLYPDLVVWRKISSTIEELKSLVDKKYLVGVGWQGVFTDDEYGDDEVDSWGDFWDKMAKVPPLRGTQGHYCVVLEVSPKKGLIRFADPYGHYAGQDRFIAIWEFAERWWDDKFEHDPRGKKKYIMEDKLMFVITKKDDSYPKSVGMERV